MARLTMYQLHVDGFADVVARINALAVSDLDDQASGLRAMPFSTLLS